MPDLADLAQAARVAGVVLLSMAAAALAAVFVFALAEHQWEAALLAASLVINLAGGVCALFRSYARHSPRHKGRH